MRNLIVGVVCGALLIVGYGVAIATASVERAVPACQEDVTLVGSGDFEFGRWSSYVCGPAVDDLR